MTVKSLLKNTSIGLAFAAILIACTTDDILPALELNTSATTLGEAGGNLVKVILSGDYELKSIIISDTAKKESQEIINDLIIAAYNNAKENLKKKSADELSKVTGGLNLPLDFKLPF